MSNSAQDIIRQSVMSISGRKKSAGDHIMIQCPFHSDNTPSCGIYMATGMSLPLGTWHCFSCNRKGGWNKLAEQLNLPQIKGWETYESSIQSIELISDKLTLPEMLTSVDIDAIEWPVTQKWRGFDGEFVRRVGGMLANDKRRNNLCVFFPIYIGKTLRGGIKAAMEKEQNVLSYVTTKGKWVAKYGLFGYNLARSFDQDYVVLVEGPRDAMRLLSFDIPAMAILGANNFSAEKALMVSSLFPERVFIIPDNDAAGTLMKKTVKEHMSKLCDTKSIKLPEYAKDPQQLDKHDIKKLKNIIFS